MSPLRLVLARHGQTDANVYGRLDSLPPGEPLNDKGQAQAGALGTRLAADPVTAVYASHAVRAQQTAAPVAAAHGLPVQVIDGVHEVFVGDLEGRSDTAAGEAFQAVYAAFWRHEQDARLPGGESAGDLRARFLPVVERIVDGARGTVVLVSHGAAIRLAAATMLGEAVETRYVPNTGLVILTPDPAGPTGWTLEHWDPAPPRRRDITGGATAAPVI